MKGVKRRGPLATEDTEQTSFVGQGKETARSPLSPNQCSGPTKRSFWDQDRSTALADAATHNGSPSKFARAPVKLAKGPFAIYLTPPWDTKSHRVMHPKVYVCIVLTALLCNKVCDPAHHAQFLSC